MQVPLPQQAKVTSQLRPDALLNDPISTLKFVQLQPNLGTQATEKKGGNEDQTPCGSFFRQPPIKEKPLDRQERSQSGDRNFEARKVTNMHR